MFSYNIGGVPALKMAPLGEIDYETPYLSSDQESVIVKDADGGMVVFGLKDSSFNIYEWNDSSRLVENNPGCAMVYPSESVKVVIRLEIMGGGDAN